MQRNLIRTMSVVAACGTLAACVTINVYFPAAAAEKAADKIIDDVWQLKQSGAAKQPGAAPAAQPPATGAQ